MGSAIVQCDGCGLLAWRRAGRPCPDHWFYLESQDRTPGGPTSVYVVLACSETCRDRLWRTSTTQTTADVGDESRVAKRPRKPGRGGIGGNRVAELERELDRVIGSFAMFVGVAAQSYGGDDVAVVDARAVMDRARQVIAGKEFSDG